MQRPTAAEDHCSAAFAAADTSIRVPWLLLLG